MAATSQWESHTKHCNAHCSLFIAVLGVRLGAVHTVHGEELAARGGRLVYKEGAVPAAGGS